MSRASEQVSARLCIFARAPELGRVKTRLADGIGAAPALAAHEEQVEGCLSRLASLAALRSTLWIAGSLPLAQPWATRWHLATAAQTGVDLGMRMANAIAISLRDADQALVVGTDCPLLDADYVDAAIVALDAHDVVVGPAEDGGYVLIGMRRLHPELFADIAWGSSHVCPQTLARAGQLGLRVAQLPVLWDVDTLEDWQRYQALRSGFSDRA